MSDEKSPTRPGYIGFFPGVEIKEALQAEAKSEHRTLSQQLTRIVVLHIKGKSPEREACAKAICEQCADGVELLYTENPLPHRYAGETVTDWVHRHGEGEEAVYEYCEASAIHDRSRLEALKA